MTLTAEAAFGAAQNQAGEKADAYKFGYGFSLGS